MSRKPNGPFSGAALLRAAALDPNHARETVMSDTTKTVSHELLDDAAQAAGLAHADHVHTARDGFALEFESVAQCAAYFLRLGELATLRGVSVDQFEDMLDSATVSGADGGPFLHLTEYVLDDARGAGLMTGDIAPTVGDAIRIVNVPGRHVISAIEPDDNPSRPGRYRAWLNESSHATYLIPGDYKIVS